METNPAGGPASGMKLLINTRDDGTIVVCAGRLTADVAGKFKSEIRELIPKAKRLVLDLSAITYLDSSGLGAVVGLYVSARAAGAMNPDTMRTRRAGPRAVDVLTCQPAERKASVKKRAVFGEPLKAGKVPVESGLGGPSSKHSSCHR